MNFPRKIKFILTDLNSYCDGFFPLYNRRAMQQIEEIYGPIHNGQKIWCSCVSYNKDKKLDPTIFLGEVENLQADGEAEIHADEKDFVYLSESKDFRNYSIEEVIGSDLFDSIKRTHPEQIL